jgi:hypothetical protein
VKLHLLVGHFGENGEVNTLLGVGQKPREGDAFAGLAVGVTGGIAGVDVRPPEPSHVEPRFLSGGKPDRGHKSGSEQKPAAFKS